MRVISPLAIYLPRKRVKPRKHILNLNNYRNWHFQVSNQIKRQYREIIKPQVSGFKFDKVHLMFKLYKSSNRKIDRANIYAIHEKFLCDALVYWKVIRDDSDEYILSSTYHATELDKDNPRCEVDVIGAY